LAKCWLLCFISTSIYVNILNSEQFKFWTFSKGNRFFF
jgi:hypothetical protein